MILDRNENKEVAVLLGAGSMGMAILRRVAAGKKILLGGRRQSSLDRAAESLRYSGYDVETMIVNALEKESVEAFAEKAASLGNVKYFIISPFLSCRSYFRGLFFPIGHSGS